MKKTILLLILTLTMSEAKKIQFQSKLYITPSDDSALEIIDDNRLCIQGKYGFFSVDISDVKKPKILKNTPCFISKDEDENEKRLRNLKDINLNLLEENEEIYYYNKEYLLVIEDNLCDAFTNFIKLLDIRNPLKPKFVDNVKVKDFNHGFQLLGNKVLFLGNKGLWIYTID